MMNEPFWHQYHNAALTESYNMRRNWVCLICDRLKTRVFAAFTVSFARTPIWFVFFFGAMARSHFFGMFVCAY
jgi:hypothetical protein